VNQPSPLAGIPTEDLVAEIMHRADVIPSIWNLDDAKQLIVDDADCGDLTDAQAEEAARMFTSGVRDGMEDILGQRGNDYLSDRWQMDKAAILTGLEAGEPTP